MNRVEIIGHRGVMSAKPENTLSSFEEALRLGVDGVFTNHPVEMRKWIEMYSSKN